MFVLVHVEMGRSTILQRGVIQTATIDRAQFVSEFYTFHTDFSTFYSKWMSLVFIRSFL